jgi:hypothetical protein
VLALSIALMTHPDGTLGAVEDGTPVNQIPVEESSLLGTEAERVVALADFDCRVATDYISHLTTIRVDLDNAYLRTNQEALDRLAAAAQSW